MIAGVPVESYPQEKRVALVPAVIPMLAKSSIQVLVQHGAGEKAGISDSLYEEQGARIANSKSEIFAQADFLIRFHGGIADLNDLRAGQVILGLLDPLGDPNSIQQLATKGVIAFALELLPRISRAQPMDALSSMATIAGYKAVLLAADSLKKIFPMMITAAGTISPSRVFVIGAGVAGLQAIATARRLGAVVQAFDVRPAVKEQVESLGAKFVELGLETQGAEGAGGYAKAMDEDFYRKQREMMTRVLGESDVIITTAAIPGKRAPVLITKDMISAIRAGSIIIDLAAETGGNCELTKPGETIELNGISIMGPVNLPSTIPYHASQLYSRNISAFLQLLVKDGKLEVDLEDQIIRETLLTQNQQVVNPRVRELLGLSSAAS